ncbi:hypothetical protein T10_12674 [Trichinella papuae]|uniref:Uncharacterized protein n=1 Tax=Trichinella papuae TaxID=268474 RepID=A0A0V1N961_9BILA|nr:hypothetical protein T10_12674 [Trichinella papuae]
MTGFSKGVLVGGEVGREKKSISKLEDPEQRRGCVSIFFGLFASVNNNSKSKPFPHNPCPTAPTPHYLYIYL